MVKFRIKRSSPIAEITVGLLIVMYFSWVWCNRRCMIRSSIDTQKILLTQKHECTDGGHDEIDSWGLGGGQRYCVKDGRMHGKWVAWESGRKQIEGNYLYGKEQGKWIFYDKDGKEEKVIYYENGKEKPQTVSNSKDNRPNEQRCKGGENRECTCSKGKGDVGAQYCKADGAGWEKCNCFVDGIEL